MWNLRATREAHFLKLREGNNRPIGALDKISTWWRKVEVNFTQFRNASSWPGHSQHSRKAASIIVVASGEILSVPQRLTKHDLNLGAGDLECDQYIWGIQKIHGLYSLIFKINFIYYRLIFR